MADNFNDTVTVLINQTVPGDPLNSANFFGQTNSVYAWATVAGGKYDVIRGQLSLVTQGPATNNLGPVTCLANDLASTPLDGNNDGIGLGERGAGTLEPVERR